MLCPAWYPVVSLSAMPNRPVRAVPGHVGLCLARVDYAWLSQTVPGKGRLCLATSDCAWPSQTVPESDCVCICLVRVGQSHIHTVYIHFFWQENYQMYVRIRCVYAVLVYPMPGLFQTTEGMSERKRAKGEKKGDKDRDIILVIS